MSSGPSMVAPESNVPGRKPYIRHEIWSCIHLWRLSSSQSVDAISGAKKPIVSICDTMNIVAVRMSLRWGGEAVEAAQSWDVRTIDVFFFEKKKKETLRTWQVCDILAELPWTEPRMSWCLVVSKEIQGFRPTLIRLTLLNQRVKLLKLFYPIFIKSAFSALPWYVHRFLVGW